MEKYYNSTSAVKCSSWFRHRRPPFMEPGVPPPHDGFGLGVPLGVPPPHDGYERGGGGGGALRMMRRMSSSFPIKDDAGYIGYLSDDDDIMSVVHRRRRQLLGPDISFTMCCLLMVMVMMVMVMVVWGFRPPATGSSGVAVNIDRR